MERTYGPAYDKKIDGKRINNQMEKIKQYMLGCEGWKTLFEIEQSTGYSQASISAQLRHLRKKKFGEYNVSKKRREYNGEEKGTWEYSVREKHSVYKQMDFFLKQ